MRRVFFLAYVKLICHGLLIAQEKQKGALMIKLFAFPFVAAALMTTAWISTLGGGTPIVLSGLALGLFTFWANLRAARA